MFLSIFYNILGFICVFVLIWLIRKLLMTFQAPIAPIPLKVKIFSLLLGALAGFAATVAAIYAAAALFLILGIPTDEYILTAILYFAAGFSFSSAYGISRIITIVYRRGPAKPTLYSALIVSVYFTVQPIGYSWLCRLFNPTGN
jgi:hypothetical protein